MHSIICNRVHIVFATAERRALIPDDLQERLWAYIGGVARNLDAVAMAVGGTADHVHILLSMPGNKSLSELVQKIKTNSSRWISDEGRIPLFSWQKGYGAFSVAATGVKPAIEYILGQSEHHRRRDFRKEWLQILRQHGISPAAPESESKLLCSEKVVPHASDVLRESSPARE
jgi:REP-associated tyrosine transposase